jgi:hypothetical protein
MSNKGHQATNKETHQRVGAALAMLDDYAQHLWYVFWLLTLELASDRLDGT